MNGSANASAAPVTVDEVKSLLARVSPSPSLTLAIR
jgi:hypothetical protein